MKIKYNSLFCLLTLFLTFSTPASADEFDEILELIPADTAVSLCLPNPQTFDTLATQIDKEYKTELRELSEELQAYSKNIDLSKPAAFLYLIPEGESFDPLGIETVLLVPVKSFQTFLEEHDGSKNAEKTWEITLKGSTYCVEQKGNFALLSSSILHSQSPNKALLHYTELIKKGSLKDRLGSERSSLRNSTFFLRLSIPAWRKTFAEGWKQARQFLPLLAMGASQGGADPSAAQNMFSGFIDLLEEFFTQCASLDLAFQLEANRSHLRGFARFEPGSIANYLKTQKPGRSNPFAGLPFQDFSVAFAMDHPGENSNAYSYFISKLFPSKSENPSIQEMLSLTQGGSGILGMSTNTGASNPSMELYFQYFSKNHSKLLELYEKLFQTPQPFLDAFAKGIQYKPTGTRKVGEVEIHDWEMNAEEASDLVQESMERMYGEKPRFFLSQGNFGMRYAMGNEKTCESFLTGKVSQELSTHPRLQAALAKLPSQYNGIVLIDLLQIARLGMALSPIDVEQTPQLPASQDLIAFSFHLAGEPTQFDLEMPFQPLRELVNFFASTTRSAASTNTPRTAGTLSIGSAAPEWELKNEKGETVSLKSLRGKVVLMDFWATWCGPCRQSMPRIQKIHERFAGKPVAVYGINCWEDSMEKAKEYMKEKKYSYGLLLDGDQVATKYKVKGIPTFYLIGADGKILYSTSGFSADEEEELIKEIEKALPK